MSLAVAVGAERAQVPRIIPPAQLTRQDVMTSTASAPHEQRNLSRRSAWSRTRRHARDEPLRAGSQGRGERSGSQAPSRP